MPTIVAICPYCREGGVRAPETSIGASATCPKCKSSFTVMPSDGLPGWAKVPEQTSPLPARKEAAPPSSSPLEETRAASAMPDVTEPSPVLPAEARPKSDPAPASTSASTFMPAVALDTGLVFALAAVILVGPAVLASQLPYGRVIGLMLAGLGFAGGLLSLGAEGRAKLAGIAAAVMHFLIVVVLLFLPSWLGLDEWRSAPAEEPKKPIAREHGTGVALPLADDGWVEAGRSSWEYDDVRITVRSTLGPVELRGPNGARRTTKEPYLQLTIQIANVGAERPVPLSGWAAGQGAEGVRVVDTSGRVLSPAAFDGGFAPDHGRPAAQAVPGHSSEVVLIFTAPAPKTEFVRVQLPGAGVGAAGEIKFRVGVLGGLPRIPGK